MPEQLETKILPLLPLTTGVVLPHMVVTLTLETDEARASVAAARSADDTLLLVPRTEAGAYAGVGTVAKSEEMGRTPGGVQALVIRGLHRAMIGSGIAGTGDATWVQVEPAEDTDPTERAHELATQYRATLEAIIESRGAPQLAEFLRGIDDPGALADMAGYSPDLSFEQKVEVLETLDLEARLEKVLAWAKQTLAEVSLKDKIREEVAEGMDQRQREFLLRQQMDAIRKELGEDSEENVAEEYRKKIEAAGMPEAVRKQAEQELKRFERTSEQNPEYGWIRTYLDWLVELPWSVRTEDNLDITDARRILDEDHTGLEDVKDRIIEYLAVRKLRAERGLAEVSSGRGSGAILTLIGPPGVGKTSLGESVARALGRKFVRFSLGGIHDEAEIRGHRRTYVGALPGRIVRALKDAGTKNPVMMLDEMDKVGADCRGQPLQGALVVLGPGRDYTREAGVRNLERELGKLLRKVATTIASQSKTQNEAHFESPPVVVGAADIRTYLGRQKFWFEAADRTSVPGVATGLAVTGTGGDVLFIEATAMPESDGHGEPGLTLTGQLGDVMKESAQIALSYVRSHWKELGITPERLHGRFHVHVPAGAVPKDGPSAGVTMTTALASLLSNRPVKATVGMTGEVTLQGRVLPIGGGKQKVLAAHRAGLKEVILPKRNEGDLEDVPEQVRNEITFHTAETVDEGLEIALEPADASKGSVAA